MRIATIGGVLLVLAGCNELPAATVSGDDQSLVSGSAGAGESDAAISDGSKNESAEAEANVPGVSDCELKAKSCYADGVDPAICDSILKSCLPPAPVPSCGEDCDSSVRACFAKGIDAKTCDAQYHACLDAVSGAGKPVPGDASSGGANDPGEDCAIAAKQCLADGIDPEKCQAILASCTPPPPADGSAACKLDYTKCLESGTDPGKCDLLLVQCAEQVDTEAKTPG